MSVPPEAETPEVDAEAARIRRIAGGDRGAFEELYRTHRLALFRFLLRMVGRVEDAEELLSDVMLAVWRAARTFRAGSKVSTWIFGIARHKALDALRTRRRAPEPLVESKGSGGDPEEDLRRADLGRRVRDALGALSPEHREVLLLTFVQGFSYAEIAEAVRCPINTVKTRMFHARRKLQERLQAAGITGVEP